jgi:hypothetical protein
MELCICGHTTKEHAKPYLMVSGQQSMACIECGCVRFCYDKTYAIGTTNEETKPLDSYDKLIEEIKTLSRNKAYDYAELNNRFSNFEFVAELVKHFSNPIDQVFVSFIGTKLARLFILTGSDKINPINESIRDSRIDLANYCLLWAAYHDKNNNQTSFKSWEKKHEKEIDTSGMDIKNLTDLRLK